MKDENVRITASEILEQRNAKHPIHISPLVKKEMERLRHILEVKGLIPHTPTVFELSEISEPCNPCNPCGHCPSCSIEEQGYKP